MDAGPTGLWLTWFPSVFGAAHGLCQAEHAGVWTSCVVAGAPETRFGNAIPGAVEDVSANGASLTAAIWEAKVKFTRRASAAKRIPAPVAILGVNLEATV